MPLESGDIDSPPLLDIVVSRIRYDVSLRFASFYHREFIHVTGKQLLFQSSLSHTIYTIHLQSSVLDIIHQQHVDPKRCIGDIINR